MPRFTVVAVAPAMAHPATALAAAASRADGVGVVDLTRATDGAVDAVRALSRQARGPWGVRYRCQRDEDASLAQQLVDVVGHVAAERAESVTVLVEGHDPVLLRDHVATWRGSTARVLVEVTSVEEAQLAVAAGADGLVARGNEAGGRVAEEGCFVLLQKILAVVDVPVLAQGGLGLHSAAAAVAVGAAGVVLDAQLLLTRESPLKARDRAPLAPLDGSETRSVGTGRGFRYRVLIGRNSTSADVLGETASSNGDRPQPWDARVEARLGWDLAAGDWMPVGQDSAMAAGLAATHRTTGRVVRAVAASVHDHLGLAARIAPLAEGAPLARSHGTRFPLVQGPMTRVSDQPAFARAVADAGALPFIALAMLGVTEADDLVSRTATALGDRPWGVGVLGFVPDSLRDAQLETIRRHRPPFALVAGGAPDHVAALEAAGVATYLHVPSPALLHLFARDGVRRFVFEGRECGGHVGPRSSFVLWDGMVEELLRTLRTDELEKCHVLFAGGVHDAASAAGVAAVAAPLARAGAKVGALMGTAYLFTDEIVDCGGVTPTFQEQALACDSTALLESGPGYATRCARTAIVEAFAEERTRLAVAGRPAAEVTDGLERFNLGRLRLAAKGLAHGADGPVPTDADRQRVDGLFMMGEVAALHSAVQPITRLHEDVSAGSTARLRDLVDERPAAVGSASAPRVLDVAIVGMSCLLPGANDLEEFWANILAGRDLVGEVPTHRWDPARYFDADPAARDKTYSRWGGFLDELRFDPLEYGMPPNSLPHVEGMQILALHAVRAAIRDAGYEEADLPRESTCVVLGAGGGVGDLGQKYAVRSALPELLGTVPEDVLARLPEWSEDSFPGILLNVTAGRVANRFDLGGLNCIIDAACASSLAALHLGALELRSGTSDVAVVGGIDTVQNPFGYLAFAKTGALSPTGRCRPFDESADGIAISEGVAVVVLKRLEDAERDGDRVYAVVKGIGGSSDGRARGLTAPRPEGQALALTRAYTGSGVDPASIGLVEAHGTGTVTGDRVEVETLRTVYEAAGAEPRSCAIGSVKSMIGHTKSTAGLAGLVKLAKSLHHRVLPPTIGVTSPNAVLTADACPFYVNTAARPWLSDDRPRRAAVSAFGFGGTNFHAVLEEYADENRTPRAGAVRWPAELFTWTGSAESVRGRVDRLLADLDHPLDLTALAAATRGAVDPREAHGRLAVVAESREELRARLGAALEGLDRDEFVGRGVWWTAAPDPGAVAFLYPGQGSQRPGMLADLALHFPEVREAFERSDETLARELPVRLRHVVFPLPAFTPQERQSARDALRATRFAQPALGAAAVGVTRLLAAFGIRPAMAAGHSYGEYPALWAAGALDETTLFRLSEQRGRCIAEHAGADAGSMLAVPAPADEVAVLLESVPEVWLSNLNAPRQTVVSGSRAGLDRAAALLTSHGLEPQELTVAAAFHSPLVAPAREAFGVVLRSVRFAAPVLPVFANATGAPYPDEPADVAAMLDQHLVTPVHFVESVEAMHAAGARTFVEVGPGTVLTGLVDQILGDRPHAAVAVDAVPGGPTALLATLARLWTRGAPVDFDRLAEDRVEDRRAVKDVVAAARAADSRTAWLVDGAGARAATARREVVSHPDPDPEHRAAAPQAAAPQAAAPQAAAPQAAAPPSAAVPAPAPVTPAAPSGAVEPATGWEPGAPASGSEGRADVVVEFQRLMDRFLLTNRDVMLNYLHGPDPAGPSRVVEGVGAGSGATDRPPDQPIDRAIEEQPDPQPDPQPDRQPDRQPDPQPDPAAPGRDDLPEAPVLQQLRELLVERTGYPVEMLDPDLDLEADLGIDSIKRVEVIGAFQQRRASAAVKERVAAVVPVLRRTRTLSGMAQVLEEALAAGPEEPADRQPSVPPPPEPSPVSAPPGPARPAGELPTEVPRQRLGLVELGPPAAGAAASVPGTGVVVVTDDGRGVAAALVERLARRGVRGVRVQLPPVAESDGPGGVGEAVEAVRARSGPIRGLVHLQPIGGAADATAGERRVVEDVVTLTELARVVAPDVADGPTPGFVLVATAGGRSAPIATSMAAAASAGLATTLAAEWPSARVRVVDLGQVEDPVAAAAAVESEILDPSNVVEVRRRDDRRWTRVARAVPLVPSVAGPVLGDDSVVLLTGGARGITAALAQGLARTYRPTLVLAGRSAEPPDDEDAATRDVADLGMLRGALVQQLRRDGRAPAVADVERRAGEIVRDRKIRATLRALRDIGVRTEYHQLDVRRRTEVRSLLDDVYARHGRLDAVVHGAGVVEDRLVVDKDRSSVERVVATKVAGALHLAEALRPESLRLLVFLTSVAGWFGNPGQGDYAAGNRALDALAARLDEEWPGRVVAMSWGPWDGGSGMVTPQVREGFLARGIVPVRAEDGVAAFLEELRHGGADNHHVVLGAGPWCGRGDLSGTGSSPTVRGAMWPEDRAGATRGDPVRALDRAGS
jgi:acyl transferase domain-containing protein/NAD(P)H-dependent flavin oxidoreductase YrpB (nitropropane dioxygenase family)/NAD(P)-dependent dehydrogenase (short-subunit alcohol dehydrogenase family)